MSKMLKVVGASWMQTKISSYILGILGMLAILALFVGQMERIQEDGNYAATVFYSQKTGYRIEYWGQSNELANIPKGVARAHFRMDINTTGWSLLEIETDSAYPDEIQAYAAGIVEGALTWYLIHTHLENTIRAKCDNTPLEKQCNKLKDTLDKSVDTWKAYAAEHAPKDPYWHQVSLYYTQISGIHTGWKHGVERRMHSFDTDISDLYWLNSVSEVLEIQHKLNITINNATLDFMPDLSSTFLRVVNETLENGTATKKLFVAQNAAGRYTSMTRILKKYKLNYNSMSNKSTADTGLSIQFSSYPGSITSQDEFYIIKREHEVVVAGVPLKNYNEQLWNKVSITEQLPIGPRITAANHLATNISSWGHLLARSNSGTASKQWLIVDMTKYQNLEQVGRSLGPAQFETKVPTVEIVTERTIGSDVRHTVYHGNNSHAKGLVGLVEQVPGLTHSADISYLFLEQGYWAAHGLPFFKDIHDITHTNKLEEIYGNIFSESQSPRAILFKNRFKAATSINSVMELMREINITDLNGTSEVPNCLEGNCDIHEETYWKFLSGRSIDNCDEPLGIIDTKLISATLGQESLEMVAISGPPYSQTPTTSTSTPINKGNLAPIYTMQFNNKANIDNLEIRDLIKHQQEVTVEDRKESLAFGIKNYVKPFEWSKSAFKNITHQGLPDEWVFGQFRPIWSW